MNELKPTWQLFEDLVCRILKANNFKIEKNDLRGDKGFDLLANLNDENWAIEVKYYRTARAQASLIDAAATRVVNNGIEVGISKGMLIVSCILSPELREALENKFSITFVDQTDLRIWCNLCPELAEELDILLETNLNDTLPAYYSYKTNNPIRDNTLIRVSLPDSKGTELCDKLQNIKKGKISWRQYEKVCEEILKYLFPNDLQGWHSQKRTDDGLNRYDYICRIRPTTEFWKFVIDHLNSRYVLFEFKNYLGKIKQGQILTTEKYLLEKGLRRMAIIMTRTGAEKNSIAMTQGAMREHGKLIIIINDEKICKMLHMKERGEDPTDYLFEIVDNFLLSLPR
ncbi:restriction endonuclease [Proteus faecis]|uniref:Restriction endonuclease n=1 Tax=Proteus faecis TaxID=2050967 RepID=A0AAW7CV09_9GAMM|nr:restriction endonuclease [Proteus faecis]MDL5167600.1 restriction endonuclease [Proteus faecis]MDL5275514.1 restriction endonuclease [Proteus faecis]MDL5279247.1 restriction endonuclease [Proteus faecis]MDL5308248.1 restriction endonuclease [Proteus faecis]MDL5311715.1 restriction endonuclease [Proteus faecis]